MHITRNKKLIIIGLVSASLIAGTALLVNKGAAFYTVQAGDAHTPSCIFNHYDKVDPTYNKHGSKEFWACCSHVGKHVFSAPEVGTIVDKGPLDGIYFDDLVMGDDRYIPSLYEDMDVLYDTKKRYYVPNEYGIADFKGNEGQKDDVYGDYARMDINKATGDALWLRPASTDSLKNYSSVIFYIKSNQKITNLGVGAKGDYGLAGGKIVLEENTWTRIEVPVSETISTVENVSFASWGQKTNLVWSITSMYGVKKAVNKETVFDVSKYQYVPQNSSYVGLKIKNEMTDPSIGACCTINFTESGDWIWFKPFTGDVSLTKYSSVYFYIKSNIELSGFGVFNHDYKWATSQFTLAANTWTKVEVEISELTPKLEDIAPAQWGASNRKNVELIIGSIYGILK